MSRRQLVWTVWFAILCVTSTNTRAQTISFAAAPSFSANTSPTSLASGKFNADNLPDLAVTNQHGISILINDGQGGFLPRVDYSLPAASNPQSVAVGEFNGDSKLDLAVVSEGSGVVTIYLGNGDGSFTMGQSYPAGSNPRMVVIADLNHDLAMDLAIVDSGTAPGTSGVSLLLGNGNGTFQAAKLTAAGTTPVSLAIDDFNHDQVPDLVVANSGSDNVSVLIGNGDGTFQAAHNLALDEPGISVTPVSVTTGDFNKDGHEDIAVSNPNVKDIAILLGTSNTTFAAPVHYPLDDPNFVNNKNVLVAVDLDGDQKLDLVLANYSANWVGVLLGSGDGSFPHVTTYAAGPSPTGVAVDDFNGDGKLDLAVSDDEVDGAVSLLKGTGGGALLAAPLYRSSFTPQSLAVGDLNGDGIPDIVAGSPLGAPNVGAGVAMLGNQDSFVTGKGGGTFKAPVTWTTTGVTSLALGDVNGDGKADIVATIPSPPNGMFAVWLGNGDGTFQQTHTYSAGTTPDTVALADVNGDHKLDAIVGNRSSTNITVLLGNGDGTFQAGTNYMTPATGTPDSVVVADFNGDGKLDIAAAISGINATSVALLLGNGNGTFQNAVTIPSGFHSSSTLSMAAGDFNGDGKSDLAVTDGTSLAVLLGTVAGVTPSPDVYTLVGTGAAIYGIVAVGDFDGDTKPDLVVSTRDGLSLLTGIGDGTFAPVANYAPFIGGAVAVGDFDLNGAPDIVAADSLQDSISTDTVAILRNTKVVAGVPLTVDTLPSGLSVSVYYGFPPGGGITSEFKTCPATPCTYTAAWGSFFQLYPSQTFATSPGTQYLLDSFSDPGPTIVGGAGELIHTIQFPAVPFTEVVKYKTQYQVTIAVSPGIGGSATPASGNYVDANATVPLVATANPGYTLTQWNSSSGPSCNANCSPVVTAPVTWTAHFTFTGQRCDLNADTQLTVVDGQSLIDQALGLAPASADLDRTGAVTIADVQLLLNVVRGVGGCPQ